MQSIIELAMTAIGNLSFLQLSSLAMAYLIIRRLEGASALST